jgi:hypothetical protein
MWISNASCPQFFFSGDGDSPNGRDEEIIVELRPWYLVTATLSWLQSLEPCHENQNERALIGTFKKVRTILLW